MNVSFENGDLRETNFESGSKKLLLSAIIRLCTMTYVYRMIEGTKYDKWY